MGSSTSATVTTERYLAACDRVRRIRWVLTQQPKREDLRKRLISAEHIAGDLARALGVPHDIVRCQPREPL